MSNTENGAEDAAIACPPGLERSTSGIRAEAPEFKPGQIDLAPWTKVDDDAKATEDAAKASTSMMYQMQYHQLMYQYSTEVPFLQSQVHDLTNKLNELENWKAQTLGLIRDLRDQHKTLKGKLGEDHVASPAPEQKAIVDAGEEDEVKVLDDDAKVPECGPPPSPPPIPPPAPPPSSRNAPPGEAPPPALPETPPVQQPKEATIVVMPSLPPPQEFDEETGLKVYGSTVEGEAVMVAEWKINHFSTKLRGAMGRPVVSSPFDIWQLDEIRLMVTPEGQESNAGARSRKEKEQFSKMVTNGPLKACLMLKVPNARQCPLNYYLRVGSKKKGPFVFDFSVTAIDNQGEFGINWLQEMKSDGSITVSVEILKPQEENSKEQPGLPPGLSLPTTEETTDPSEAQ